MFLRSLRSINNLSARFNNTNKSPKNPDLNSYLIWILLAPAEHSANNDPYHTIIAQLVEAFIAQNGVRSVIKLRAIVPYCGITPTNLTSTTCANAVLVRVESNDIESRIMNITDAIKIHEYRRAGDRSERIFHWSMTTHTQTQVFEPKRSRGLTGSCIVTVLITPSSEHHVVDVESWYRKEQLPLLSKHSPELYLRSRRYDSLPSSPVEGDLGQERRVQLMLAVHEYVSVEALLRYSLDHGQVVEETEWSRRVLGEAERVERGIWEIL